MTDREWKVVLAAVAAFALPTPLSAQEIDGDTIPPVGQLPDSDLPECKPQPESTTAQIDEGEAAEPAFIMPTTGLAFTLPPDDTPHEEGNCAPSGPPPPVRPPAPSLFRMIALPVGANAAMTKWDRARLEEATDRPGPWNELLVQASATTAMDTLDMVNRWVNWHIRYRFDLAGDEWSTVLETLSRGYGDCEDFAIAKMGLLRALGVSPNAMFLVLLRDGQSLDHAVLAVNRDGRHYVLDNRTDIILPADQIEDYTPIASYSGPFAWTYGKPAI